MKHLDEFRDPELARRLSDEIRRVATRRWTIMEVCGGQTHGLLRHGIDAELAEQVEFIHGPGCPVCVTPVEAIDFACELATRPRVLVTSFGDMLRVPGSRGSLAQTSAHGGAVRAVYSPLDAVELARQAPDRQVVFLAVGFETTAPATALAVLQAAKLGLTNFSLLAAHVRVQPAMELLLAQPDQRVHAFLAAGHVVTVMGCETYESLVARFHLPVVVTGFEPLDLLDGILACVRQLERGEARVENCYARSARSTGNQFAQDLIAQVYAPTTGPWRGLGDVPDGRLELRAEFASFDARRRFPRLQVVTAECGDCRAGEILTGRLKPIDCPAFGVRCRPESPLGAPMVSSEGACAAYFRYGSSRQASHR